MHYKYKPTEDQMINIVASGDDTEIRVINSENDTCLHTQDSDNLNYFAGDGNPGKAEIFRTRYRRRWQLYSRISRRARLRKAKRRIGIRKPIFSDYGTCGHGCSEDTVDEVSLTANTTYIIQIAAKLCRSPDPRWSVRQRRAP